jgi:hypothetical protein
MDTMCILLGRTAKAMTKLSATGLSQNRDNSTDGLACIEKPDMNMVPQVAGFEVTGDNTKILH